MFDLLLQLEITKIVFCFAGSSWQLAEKRYHLSEMATVLDYWR